MKVCFIGFRSMRCIICVNGRCSLFCTVVCVLCECCMLTEEMEGIFRSVKVEGWEGVVVRLCLENTQLDGGYGLYFSSLKDF